MLVALLTVILRVPGGTGTLVETAAQHDKFSLGSFDLSFAGPTVLVVFLYALCENLRNFGVNQTYVQLYATARTDRDARSCVWTGALLYIPLAAMTYLVGTALFAFYTAQPELLPEGIKPDRVFPHFIYTQIPVGLKGLVVAAVCAAATDSSFNCIATLFYCDIYKRYLRPKSTEREALLVLRGSTLACGVIAVGISIAMLQVQQALDAWWTLAGIVAGGMLGLFLLGLVCRRAGSAAALAGVVVGTLAIVWMTCSGFAWPEHWAAYCFPWHEFMIPVVGTALVLLVGTVVSFVTTSSPRSHEDTDEIVH
jgi:SSS family solute:Na+ symporter